VSSRLSFQVTSRDILEPTIFLQSIYCYTKGSTNICDEIWTLTLRCTPSSIFVIKKMTYKALELYGTARIRH